MKTFAILAILAIFLSAVASEKSAVVQCRGDKSCPEGYMKIPRTPGDPQHEKRGCYCESPTDVNRRIAMERYVACWKNKTPLEKCQTLYAEIIKSKVTSF